MLRGKEEGDRGREREEIKIETGRHRDQAGRETASQTQKNRERKTERK